mgnify:CR=1 FL=1
MNIPGNYFIKNNIPIKKGEFSEDFLKSGVNIYEVIRIISGIPLFLDDHYERFRNALQKKNIIKSTDIEYITQNIKLLINKNRIINGNIKFVYHFFNIFIKISYIIIKSSIFLSFII